MKRSNKAVENFGVPEKGVRMLDKMLTEEELLFLSSAEPDRDYEQQEIEKLLEGCRQEPEASRASADMLPSGQYKPFDPGYPDPVNALYHRGVLDPGEKDHTYRLGNFWNRLDIFATEEQELYLTIPENIRLEVEADYLKRYEDSLWPPDAEAGQTAVFRPTRDEVLPVEDVLAFIDSKNDQAYLADCDCRSLRHACDAPRDVCITYRAGPFSFVRRGLARPITREQARKIVIRSEELGLVHTINPGGVCNCCADCCYLFRAAEDRGCLGTWPKVSYRIKLDEDACVGCGRCLKRCKFGVFAMPADDPGCAGQTGRTGCGEQPEQKKKVIVSQIDRCQGCGLCRSTCPAGALKLIRV